MKRTRATGILLFCMLSPVLASDGEGRRRQLENEAVKLYGDSANERADAAHNLVQAGPAAIPVLLTVLCDTSKPKFDLAWRPAAKALGELKSEAAAPCLVHMLGLGDVTLSAFKSEKTIAEHEPAFTALVQIGEPVVPVIERSLGSLHPDKAYLALRVLRVINTPRAKVAVEAYIKLLEDQSRLAKEVLNDFQYGPGLSR